MPYRRILTVSSSCPSRGKVYDFIVTKNGLKIIKKRSKPNQKKKLVLNFFSRVNQKSTLEVKAKASDVKIIQDKRKPKKKDEMDIIRDWRNWQLHPTNDA